MICETLICTFDQNVQSAGQQRKETVVMGRRTWAINWAMEEGMQTNARLAIRKIKLKQLKEKKKKKWTTAPVQQTGQRSQEQYFHLIWKRL